MAISLLEEFLLLTLEDSGGQFDTVPEIFLTCGVAGAVLMDLALQGRIDSDQQAIWVVDATPTGDPVLDAVLQTLDAEPQRLETGVWLRRLSKTALDHRRTAIRRLCELGVLREANSSFLWVMQSRRYPTDQGQERVEAKRRILHLLFSHEIPTPRDGALVSLAAACLVFERTLTPGMLTDARERIQHIAQLDMIGGTIATAAKAFSAELKKAERGAILGGVAGNLVEWYDFSIYGYFATVIGPLFFPSTHQALSLMATFGVFAVGFLGRPLGAVLIGHVADRINRRTAVILSVAMMVIPSLVMGLLPTYAQIGFLAPLALVLMRFIQGVAVGGEYSSSSVLLVEAALPGRRGLISSLSGLGATLGMMLGSAVGALIMGTLPNAWGWRVAFLIGLLLGLGVFLIRRHLPQDETVAAVEKSRRAPVVEIFSQHWTTVLRMSALMVSGFIGGYLCNVYLVTWLMQNTRLTAPVILSLNAGALGVSLLVDPLLCTLSDRVGRKLLLMIGSLLVALFTVPIFLFMEGALAPVVLAGQILLVVLLSCMGAGSTVYLVEAFPRHLRTSGMAISLNITALLFGGTLPLIAVYLTTVTGNALAPAWYLVAAAMLTAIMAAPMRSLDTRRD